MYKRYAHVLGKMYLCMYVYARLNAWYVCMYVCKGMIKMNEFLILNALEWYTHLDCGIGPVKGILHPSKKFLKY